MKKLLILLSTFFALVFCFAARAGQVRLPVDSATSTLEVQLCVQGTCDTQISSLRGFLVVGLDENGNPTQIALRNFDLAANSDYNFRLDYGFLGNIVAHARDLRIYHAQPGPAQPFAPVSAEQFTFANVPYLMSGTADYTASGFICSVVESGGNPCSTNLDLSTLGQSTISQLGGSIQVVNGTATVHLDFTFTSPLDPSNPSLGTISGHAIVNASAPVSTSLVPQASDWRYVDNGVEPASNWKVAGFDDSGWGFGPAQLGYGDGDENTVVNYGDAANKYPTTWFRHSFNVPNASIYTNLALRVLRDDGVIVYLNGVEIFRDNLPAGVVSASTYASSAIGGTAENLFLLAPAVNPALLQSGVNVLAVEMHQSDATSSDLSFELELLGNGMFLNSPPVVTIDTPTNGTVLTGSTLNIGVSASDPDGIISRVEYFVGPDKVGESTGPGPSFNFSWQNACGGTYTLTARATDNGGASTVSAPVTVTVTRPAVSLVSTGAVWKYLDTGVNQGTAWRTNTFNDSAWASGTAQFGYGDGDEKTVVNGGPTTNRFPTIYFRKAFSVSNPGGIGALTLRLLRDDGAVVYLNGVEVYRNNMPTGTISYTTLAVSNAAPVEETTTFFAASINPGLLRSGANNVVAVEVHQATTNSTDLSFDFALEANYTNRPPVSVAITSPVNQTTAALGAAVTLQATATDSDGTIRRVEYYAGTNRLGASTAANFAFTWNNPPAGVHVLTARAVDDCDAGTVSAPVTLRIGTGTLIASGAVWKYLDNGSDQGTAWRGLGYNDSTWASGPAQLGFGDGDEATVINGGPSNNRFMTTYFRHKWFVPRPQQVLGLYVRLLRDDGVVLYLNGNEVLRSNMPEGPITAATPAVVAIGGADETTYLISQIGAESLVSGTNVLAAEVHQNGATSSDLSFDLELIAVLPPPLTIVPGVGSHQVRWPSVATGYKLYSATSLTSPNWQPVAGVPSDNGVLKTLTLQSTGVTRFYRLQLE